MSIEDVEDAFVSLAFTHNVQCLRVPTPKEVSAFVAAFTGAIAEEPYLCAAAAAAAAAVWCVRARGWAARGGSPDFFFRMITLRVWCARVRARLHARERRARGQQQQATLEQQ